MKRLALVFSLAMSAAPVHAVPISFSGAELAALPGISFPRSNQTIMGDSLFLQAFFNGDITFNLPLDQFDVDASDFEVQIDMTRTLNRDGVSDFHPAIHLGDGLNLFGGFFSEGTTATLRTNARVAELRSDGLSLGHRELFPASPEVTVFLGSSFIATLRVQSTATGTHITTNIDNGVVSAAGVTSTVFDPSNGGPSLVLAPGGSRQNYLINSVTFTRGVRVATAVPEPGALGGVLLGLAAMGVGLYRREFKSSRIGSSI